MNPIAPYDPRLSSVVRQERIFKFYSSWEQHLLYEESRLQRPGDATFLDQVGTALKIKHLIYDVKGSYFNQVFQEPYPHASQMVANQIGPLEEVLENITNAVNTVKKRTIAVENRLLTRTNRPSDCIASVAGIIANSSYVQKATSLIDAQDQLMMNHPLGRAAGLDEPLPENYLKAVRAIVAAGFLGMDLMELKWTGVSQNIPYAVASQLMPPLDFWIRNFQRLKVGDEQTVATCLPWIRQCIQLGLLVCMGSYMNSQSPLQMSVVYGVALITSIASLKLVELFYRSLYGQLLCPTYPLVRSLVGLVAFPFAAFCMTHYLVGWWSLLMLKDTDVLASKQACLAYPEECKRAACYLLGVNPAAEPKEMRAAYRKMVKQTHPDRFNRSGLLSFQQVTDARDFCLGNL